MSLFRTRLSSFAVGFACAAAYGAYALREDIHKANEKLVRQVSVHRVQRPARPGGTACRQRANLCRRSLHPGVAPLLQAHAFEERLARLEAAASAKSSGD